MNPKEHNAQVGRTLNEVLARIHFLGQVFYNGKHHDNILNIWADLEEGEKRILLLASYHMYAVNNGGMPTLPPALTPAPPEEPKPKLTDLPPLKADETLEDYDKRLMVRTKHIVTSAFVIVAGLFIIALAGSVITMDFETAQDSKLDFIIRVLQIFVDGK